jgi:hypothetical protein
MNLKTLIIAVISLISNSTHAQSPLFRIDSCGIYYNGDTLRLGGTIDQWIQVLGEPSRNCPNANGIRLFCQWDHLGVAIRSGIDGARTVRGTQLPDVTDVEEVYFFFQTIHQDPEMKNRWRALWIADYEPNNRKKLRNGKKTWQDFGLSAYSDSLRNPIHFFEPLYPLKKVELDGMVISKHTQIESLNPERMEKGLEAFRYFGGIKEYKGYGWSRGLKPYRFFRDPTKDYLTEHDRITYTFPSEMGFRLTPRCIEGANIYRIYFDNAQNLIALRIQYDIRRKYIDPEK